MTNETLVNAIKVQRNAARDLDEIENLLGMPDRELMQQSIAAFKAQGKDAVAMYAAAITEWKIASEEMVALAEQANDIPAAESAARLTKAALRDDLPRYERRLNSLKALVA